MNDSGDAASELEQRARAWLAGAGFAVRRVEALAGDVSARRYWRLELDDGRRAVLAGYPHSIRDDCGRFLTSTSLLEAAGVRVPRVLAADCRSGRMLVEDLGPETLYERRPEGASLDAAFAAAAALLDRIQTIPQAAVSRLNPPLEAGLLRRELEATREAFLAPRRLLGDAAEERRLLAALDRMCQKIADQPTAVCHRDFMVRNLLPLPDGELALIDHQGLRSGPRGYDLASLLNDSLFPGPETETRLVARHLGDDEAARRRYHRLAAQRTLKAAGTYAAFARRGNDRHLPLLAPTFERALAHLARLPEGRNAAAALSRRWRAADGDAVC